MRQKQNKRQPPRPPRFSSRPIDVVLELKRELEAYDKNRDRSVLIKALREQFLTLRYDAAGLVERDRLAALEILFERMPDMSDSMLLKTVQVLSDIGAVDMTPIIGPSKTTPPFIFQQNMGGYGQSAAGISSENNPVKNTGHLLEALEHLSNYFRGKVIDVKPDKLNGK
jgi:hypothetical protein